MYCEELTFEEFKALLDSGKRRFINVSIEYYERTLENYDLEEIVFQSCFVNFNFKNCNLKNSIFINCNLTTISLIDCNMDNCHIANCAIESIEIKSNLVEKIVFGTNSAYGNEFDTFDCQKHFLESNSLPVPKTILTAIERREESMKDRYRN